MSQALYRKYRSKKLSEIVGQDHITKTLAAALNQDRISHAYLFTGPRGVGKTSVARILAHEINGLPYTDDKPHIDIIEIDAASNRRIDEIRELRDKVHVTPASAKYKVYIIDEVHMLTREAFNALLKTLEEPPAHVVFILATTDAHKLPATIVSRTQRFNFKPVPSSAVAKHLRFIAKSENLSVSDEALQLLAEHGEGSFRDSISLLDQAVTPDEELTAESVQQLIGLPPMEQIRQLLNKSLSGEPKEWLKILEELFSQGFRADTIAKQLARELRGQLIENEQRLGQKQALKLLKQLIMVPASLDPEHYLELCLLEMNEINARDAKPTKIASPETEPTNMAEAAKAELPAKNDLSSKGAKQLDSEIWPDVLAALKQRYNTLYGIVRMAQPDFSEPGSVKLAFAFAFHQKRSNEAANQRAIKDIIEQLTGQTVKLECILSPNTKNEAVAAPKQPANGYLSTISNIFGNAELLES